MNDDQDSILSRLTAPFMEIFGLSRLVASALVFLIAAVFVFAVYWFVHSAPPRTIRITAGPEGSTYRANAEKYREILASNGVTLKILPSEGSQENLRRLGDRRFRVDVGFAQGGLSSEAGKYNLVSLGSVAYEPLMVFCRGDAVIHRLSQLEGKRLAIGPPGSGTRSLVLALLETNGITAGSSTVFTDSEATEAAKDLLAGEVDAIFLMGDSASTSIMRQLLRAPGIQLLDFEQAEAYTRRITFLNKLQIPEGGIDLGKNIPSNTVNLIGPSTELLARPNLNPAVCDLLLDAARQVHGGASLLKRKGEFPAPVEQDFPISPDASAYYLSGKSFLYQHLPYRIASLVGPLLIAIVPALVLLVPMLRTIPAILRLRVRLRLYRWYRALMVFERDLLTDLSPEKRRELLSRLDGIEESVNLMKVSAPFADQFYSLRLNIAFVRNQIARNTQASKS